MPYRSYNDAHLSIGWASPFIRHHNILFPQAISLCLTFVA
nr:MAG TPA: hypothetical protein [Crassvirales sp.]